MNRDETKYALVTGIAMVVYTILIVMFIQLRIKDK